MLFEEEHEIEDEIESTQIIVALLLYDLDFS
jgi:hypothetical protein